MVYDWLRPGTPYGFTYPPFAGPGDGADGVPAVRRRWWRSPLSPRSLTTALLTWWLVAPMIRREGGPSGSRSGSRSAWRCPSSRSARPSPSGRSTRCCSRWSPATCCSGSRAGGAGRASGIGLATAIKLTPGVFILYLLVTRRWRAALIASGTAAAATLLAAAIFPDESREFWTSALWDTNRVGVLSYVSNQSLRGILARLPIDRVEAQVWIVCVLARSRFWAWRVRQAPDDVFGGLALTGVLGCLISPVTWVHHCVWLLPGAGPLRRRGPPDTGRSTWARPPTW